MHMLGFHPPGRRNEDQLLAGLSTVPDNGTSTGTGTGTGTAATSAPATATTTTTVNTL
jgi:hypothetical protein